MDPDKNSKEILPEKPMPNHPNAVVAEVEPEGPDKTPPKSKDSLTPDYHKKPKRSKHVFLILVLLLLITAGAIYWFVIRAKPAVAPTVSDTNQTASNSNAATPVTKKYDSANFSLSFYTPKDWTVTDVSGSGILTARSPVTKLSTTSSSKTDGQIVMTIRDKTQKLTEFDKGAATAIADSEKIAYTKPSETQRGSTYISFLNYASTTAKGIDGIYITGDAGYQKDQDIPSADIAKSDPIINVTFLKCSDSKCAKSEAMTIPVSAWNDTSFSKPIKTMLQSLSIQ